MSKNTTKRSLLASVFALVLCVAMLVGSTFAWFTDTATTGVNKIQSGKLDVKLSYLTKDKEWKEVTKDTKLFKDGALWEPGHTEVAYLKVENVGKLALKYQLSVNVANEVAGKNANGDDIKLSKYINMGVVENQSTAFANRDDARAAVTDAGSIATTTKTGSIAAKGDAQYVALVVYMPETVGNEANYKENHVPSIDLGVTLVATQDAVESDSFDSSYDEGAVYPITAVGAVDAVDGTVKTDVTIFSDEQVEIDENVKASAAKATIPAGAQLTDDAAQVTLTITSAAEPANFTVGEGESAKTYEIKIPELSAQNTEPITLELYVGKGMISPKMYHNGTAMADSDYSYDAATGMMTIKTATFSPFTVVYKEAAAKVGDVGYEKLEDAISAANGEKIVLGQNVSTRDGLKVSGEINIDLNGKTWTLGNNSGLQNEAKLNVSNGKILGKTSSGYIDIRPGTGHAAEVTFSNVAFENTYKLGSKAGGSSTTYTDYILKYNASAGDNLDLTFTGCTFKNAELYIGGYSQGGSETVLFDQCTFTGVTNDSFIEGGYYNTGTVTVKDCTFNAITTSNIEVIDLSMEKNVVLTFEGSNVFDGRVATDADKPEGAADMKLYSTQSIKAYRAKTVNGKENVTLQGMVK